MKTVFLGLTFGEIELYDKSAGPLFLALGCIPKVTVAKLLPTFSLGHRTHSSLHQISKPIRGSWGVKLDWPKHVVVGWSHSCCWVTRFSMAPQPVVCNSAQAFQVPRGKGCSCQRRRRGFDPELGRSPGGGDGQLTPVFLHEKFHGQKSLACPWGRKEVDTTEWLNTHTHMTAFYPTDTRVSLLGWCLAI